MTADGVIASRPARRQAHQPLPRPLQYALGLAALIAVLEWVALVVDGIRSIDAGLAAGHGLPQAAFLWFRYFTVQTSIGVAVLMSVTAIRLMRRRLPPAAPWHAAALVYILVVCATYEAMLRRSWTPSGIGYDTDLIMHDIVPALMLVFWIGFAPKRGLGRRFSLLLPIYPLVWYIATLIAGALGESYPYNFLDVNKLGYKTVLVVGIMFQAMFYALGLATITASRRKRLAGPWPAHEAARTTT